MTTPHPADYEQMKKHVQLIQKLQIRPVEAETDDGDFAKNDLRDICAQ